MLKPKKITFNKKCTSLKNNYWPANGVLILLAIYFLFYGQHSFGIVDSSATANSIISSLTDKEKEKIENKVESLDEKIEDKQDDLETL